MSGGAHIDPSNKKIAMFISILAVVLAFSETLGKSAQTLAISQNIEASNHWAFFQAKTIRMTTLRTAAESAELELARTGAAAKEALQKRIDDWKKTATAIWPPITTTNWLRRRRKSPSCSLQHKSSPAWWR